ncbi:MAG: formate acetyltransferase [Gammaproteobacteria bacterium]|nr:formate acetyltransferase [Gammaproteobacteria bacterium]
MSESQLGHGGIQIDLTNPASKTHDSPSRVFPIANDNPKQVKTLRDLSLTDISINDFQTVKWWRERLFLDEGTPEICDELPRLLTEFMRDPANDELPPYQRRAEALNYIFSKKTPLVRKTDLLPGQTTTSFVGPVIYADTIGYCIWPELNTVTHRAQNPFKIKPEVAERLNKEIFPYWLQRLPVQEVARYRAYDTQQYRNDGRDTVDGGHYHGIPSIDPQLKKAAGETPTCQALMERVSFFLSDKATCVSHTVPDFARVLKYGLNGLIQQANNDIANSALSDSQQQFLKGVVCVFEGAKNYAQHLAQAAAEAGNTELSAICQRVPAQPARTLHEAITSIWICYHLLLQENTNFGLSIGRLDQLLNPYYLSDWSQLGSGQERDAYTKHAVELMCHFFLRCSDHVPLSTEGSETLFAGSGSNQALTVGGTQVVDGKVVDAVNDMTYIILKATELLGIRDPNVHARYHKDVHHRDASGNPLPAEVHDGYLKRICQVNILTRATPALHGDAAVVDAMASYYAAHDGVSADEALADAHDYASIGCIEQNSAGKHYGNTGSTLMVLPAVLELAMFGGKHRSDGIAANDPNLFYGASAYTTPPLSRMKTMEEFIAAFRIQLDEMARHAVQCNNYLGRAMEDVRPSPFLSGLFVGPSNLPGGQGAKFRDVAAGGAKYNSAGVAIIGLADVIDSFCIFDQLVFGKKISVSELLSAMNSNFGQQAPASAKESSWIRRIIQRIVAWLRLSDELQTLPTLSDERIAQINQLLRRAPKYGAGIEQTPGSVYDNHLAVKYTHLLTEMIHDTFYKYRTHRGGRYLVGYWSMTNHAGFGMLTKATPNGRRGGQSFASGITPCPNIVKANGDPVMIFDHMLSVAEVRPQTVQNGYTYNLSLTTRDAEHFDADTELFSRYMKAFMDHDGVLVQLCVSSIEDLRAAHKAANDAEAIGATTEAKQALTPFKDLMIRVAGYSAYFVTLSPQMRQEIIDRANFSLDTGKETHTAFSV